MHARSHTDTTHSNIKFFAKFPLPRSALDYLIASLLPTFSCSHDSFKCDIYFDLKLMHELMKKWSGTAGKNSQMKFQLNAKNAIIGKLILELSTERKIEKKPSMYNLMVMIEKSIC